MTDERIAPQDLADRYVAELMNGGHAVDPGQFTMDREVAREKLAEFQLPEPSYYAVLLIRSALIQSARHVEVRTDARGVQMRFNGMPYGRPDLESLYDVAMGGATDARSRSLRALALGLRTVSAMEEFVSVDVVSGDAEHSTRLRLETGRGEILEEAPPGLRGTAVVIRFRGRTGAPPPEVDAIDERCGYAEAEIYVNGRDVTHGLRLRMDEAVLTTTFDEDGIRGAAGFVPEQRNGARLHLVQDGVLVTTSILKVAETRFAAVVDAPELELDLSQFDVVMDDDYTRIEASVRRMHDTVVGDEDVESHCRRRLEKRASGHLTTLERRLGILRLKLYGVTAMVTMVTIAVAMFLTQRGEIDWKMPLVLAGLCTVVAIALAALATQRFIREPLHERAAELLPVGSNVRDLAVEQAQRRSGLLAQILK